MSLPIYIEIVDIDGLVLFEGSLGWGGAASKFEAKRYAIEAARSISQGVIGGSGFPLGRIDRIVVEDFGRFIFERDELLDLIKLANINSLELSQ